ncbi:hypothetical protein [Xylella fastidiosa]|uniref:hypothetical protein n=1 Tax=Xylella fastidiosa TaxID=2371 RepID=UPI001F310B6B|nr:hypothetical protein [Xylella fastidiosa]UIX80239.1 hypothetical protein LZ756_06870 [Xylella fastidiosa subsp. sandyi]
MSLTTAHRCGTVVGKELRNSESSGTRIRKPCGFFTPARFTSGGRQRYNTRKGKAARRLGSVSNLPTPTGAALRNVYLCSSHSLGDVFMTQLPAAVCFSGKSLSIIDRDGVPHLSARELARALGYKDTVSLTTAHRCGTVAGKELRNSGISGTRTRNPCGFFTPARFYVGRAAAIQHPAKGKAARRLIPVSNLPTPTGAALRNVSPWSSHESGDVL